jgi:hypothetical protein
VRSAAAGVCLAVVLVGSVSTPVSRGADRSNYVPKECPARGGRTPLAATTVPGADTDLVPPGAVSVLLCRYRGLTRPRLAFTLAGSRRLGAGPTFATLVGRFRRLPSPPPGSFACPFDDASRINAYFRYPGIGVDRVGVELLGCSFVSNGPVNRWALLGPGPKLLKQLLRLTGWNNRREFGNPFTSAGRGGVALSVPKWGHKAPNPLRAPTRPARLGRAGLLYSSLTSASTAATDSFASPNSSAVFSL